jgi:hypothetical protein
MFERQIAQTIQRITSEILKERPRISLQEILESEQIPERLKPFFVTEVEWWLYNDSLAREANKRFDFAHTELSALVSYLEQVQTRHARFDREEFLGVLDSAVKLTYNFLCRPQTTLKWYIFRGQPVKPLREVTLRFGAFTDYEYFRTVFQEWVERKCTERPTFDSISANEFERVIRRTDDQILLNCTVEDLLEIMNPIFEFLGEEDRLLVPVDALVIYFDDKNIKKLVDQLEHYRDRSGDMIGRDDFVVLLDELLNSSEGEPEADFSSVYQNDELDDVVRQHLEVASRPGSVGETPYGDEGFPPPPEPPPKTPDFIEEFDLELHEREDWNVSQQVAEALTDVPSEVVPEDIDLEIDDIGDFDAQAIVLPEEAIALETQGDGIVSEASLSQTTNGAKPTNGSATSNGSSSTNGSVSRDIRGYIDPVLERKVVKKIFHRDRPAYESALDKINQVDNWKAAFQVIDEIFIKHEIDPYSRTAIRFTDSVYGRFVPSRS